MVQNLELPGAFPAIKLSRVQGGEGVSFFENSCSRACKISNKGLLFYPFGENFIL